MWDVKTGDQVVCISDEWEPQDRNPKPVMGQVCTVRGTFVSRRSSIGLWFEEIRLPADSEGLEPGFEKDCFRPVRRTDISALRSLLVTSPQELVHG
jgi:hypothetical protein